MKYTIITLFILLALFESCSNLGDKAKARNILDRTIKQKLIENKGWFQGIIGDSVYNTIRNMTQSSTKKEIESGWEFVGYYSLEDYERLTRYHPLNLAIFRKKLPDWYKLGNPWENKSKIYWLPRLGYVVDNNDKVQSTKGLGHNCPTIIRRMICQCGNNTFNFDKKGAKIYSQCSKCGNIQIVWDNKAITLNNYPFQLDNMGERDFKLEYSIEYAVDSESGDDFTWILGEIVDGTGQRFVLLDGETN